VPAPGDGHRAGAARRVSFPGRLGGSEPSRRARRRHALLDADRARGGDQNAPHIRHRRHHRGGCNPGNGGGRHRRDAAPSRPGPAPPAASRVRGVMPPAAHRVTAARWTIGFAADGSVTGSPCHLDPGLTGVREPIRWEAMSFSPAGAKAPARRQGRCHGPGAGRTHRRCHGRRTGRLS
jgi:hypothetical protein